MNVGLIGLGKMGRPMAQRLLAAGFALTVHSRSRPPVDELAGAGATAAWSPAEVASASDVVLTSLPDEAAVEQVYLGPHGLAVSARPGQILVDHSTVGPALCRKLAEAVRERGADFLDAPLSGGPEGARAGTLTIMAGGEAATFEQARQIFAAYGKNVRHVGPTGAGSVVKLANQLLTAANTAAVVEAIVLGARAGADPQVMLEVISTGFGGSTMLSRNVPRMIARDFTAGTAVNQLLKDLGFVHDLGRQLSVRLLMAAVAEQIMSEGRAAGLGEADIAALVQIQEKIAGVQIGRA